MQKHGNFSFVNERGTAVLKKLVEDPHVHVILKDIFKKRNVMVSNCCLYS